MIWTHYPVAKSILSKVPYFIFFFIFSIFYLIFVFILNDFGFIIEVNGKKYTKIGDEMAKWLLLLTENVAQCLIFQAQG